MNINLGPWKKINELQRDRENLNRDLVKHMADLFNLRGDYEFLKSAYTALQDRIKELEARHTEAQNQIAIAKDEASQHKNNLLRMATIMHMRGLDKSL